MRPNGPGHVFVVWSDLTELACDAWLLPTDEHLSVRPYWRKAIPWWKKTRELEEAWKRQAVRTQALLNPTADDHDRAPLPWLTDVVGDRGKGGAAEGALAGAEAFLEAAAERARGAPRLERERPLLALPVVGTKGAGGGRVSGDIVTKLVARLADRAAQLGVDIALVAKNEEVYAASLAARARVREPWRSLEPRLAERLEALVRHAAAGRLVLFIGAGVSVGAGLPTWDGLLRQLARQAEMTDEEVAALKELDVLDRAQVVEARLKEPVQGSVAAALNSSRFSLAHALLAALPAREVVTTNYDRLFELACEATSRKVAVLPWAPAHESERWLLKMHGCVDRGGIVLTRRDYLRYDETRAALAGIVQALLITRHMLFVGFSLQDPNFHRVVDAVRRALDPRAQPGSKGEPDEEGEPGEAKRDEPRRELGTVVLLHDDPLAAELWKGDLDWLPIGDRRPKDDDGEREVKERRQRLAAARQLEIFLDALAAKSTTPTRHLLDQRFEGALSDGDRALRSAIEGLVEAVKQDPTAKESAAWPRVEAVLAELGHGAAGRWDGAQRRRG